ncbi:uncharacterized protein LOC133286596 [Gastrolobium bilobum]|uniref:uncharacterized protein LOC133286596 n=1 Tax=Gastrolobium bilobum TaxID=150636 RepID=UPI002AB0B93D|nr:uncharacterized protein LOC133286596 [Gastrolobium bilobum]
MNENAYSVFFLMSGDHPGLILVTHTLSGSNFNSWHRAMILALTTKNKLAFEDVSLPRPPSNDLLFSSWNRCNFMVISRLLNSVANDIADNLLYFSNASEGSLDINSYKNKLKSLWDELQDYLPLQRCTCGTLREMISRNEQDHVLQFLIRLNDSFFAASAQILLIDLLPSLAKVFSMILQEERQR